MSDLNISSWVRQARHRAKKHGIYNKLDVDDVKKIVEYYSESCAYCKEPAKTLDHPFPLKDKAPNISANTLPICKECKGIKKNNDLSWMFSSGNLDNDAYIILFREVYDRDDTNVLRRHMKRIVGES